MADDRASWRFMGSLSFAKKNDRWSMSNDRASQRLEGKFGLQRKSPIVDRPTIHIAFDLSSTVQIALRQSCSTVSKKNTQAWSHFLILAITGKNYVGLGLNL
jgi:hypothetical protein